MRKLEIEIINEIEAASVIPDHSKLVKPTADSNIRFLYYEQLFQQLMTK